jgi:hypothetical protein
MFAAGLVLLGGCARNKPPEVVAVKAFPDEVSVGDTVELLGRGSDPERGKLKYKWTSKDGKLVRDEDTTAAWVTPNKPGSYKVTLTVTDPKGLKDEKSVDIKVLVASQMYTGSLNAPAGTQKKQRERGKNTEEPAKKPPRGGRSGKTK